MEFRYWNILQVYHHIMLLFSVSIQEGNFALVIGVTT